MYHPYRSLAARRKSCVPPAIERLTCSAPCQLAPAFFAGAFCDFDISIVPQDPFLPISHPGSPLAVSNEYLKNLARYRSENNFIELHNNYNTLCTSVLCKNISRFRAKIHPAVLRVANYINPTGLARRDYIKTRLDKKNIKETNISCRILLKLKNFHIYHDEKKFSAPYRTEYKNAKIGKSIARANSTTNSSNSYPSLRHAPSRPPSVVRECDGRAH
ncbi:hypothetical protein ALC60_04353 [Trachymyrmex zeteki]|uniref:Uncharacterized protein n=1 Tax=Mycetomoellerius zeteki TaxID=64791 RepID=A0A151X8U4_9HYME|nr:hypothetical protein ALC60_04353 [Trachymyrmex zeteki]